MRDRPGTSYAHWVRGHIKQGFATGHTQVLTDHADGEMVAYYQEGHEEKAIEYQRARANLKL